MINKHSLGQQKIFESCSEALQAESSKSGNYRVQSSDLTGTEVFCAKHPEEIGLCC